MFKAGFLIPVVLSIALSVAYSQATPAGHGFLEAQAGPFIVRVESGAAEPAMVGSYAVRLYRGTTEDNFISGRISDRDGELAGLWLVDLEHDNTWDVLVWNRSGGSGQYGRLDRYRIEGDQLIRDDLPAPDPQLLAQYMGHDEFAVLGGELRRSFPLYRPGDPNADPTRGRRTLVYRGAAGWQVADR